MKAPIDEFVSILDRLSARLDELESRVAALEHRPARPAASTPVPALLPQHPLAQVSRSGGVMPVIGKIFLGMAGAYLLRALAESSAMPRLAVACMALAYAGAWVVWAARTSPGAVFASTAYASTAAVILPPMLWELTLRFQVISPAVAAGVLVGFAGCAAALAWKRRLVSVVWTPTVFSALAALALLLGTRDPLPFIVALLAIALITEATAGNRWPSLRPLVALSADLGLLALIAIYTSANGVSPDYKPVSPALLLRLFAAVFVIYAASILSHTVPPRRGSLPPDRESVPLRGEKKISGFEIAQMAAAFLLAVTGMLRVTHFAAAVPLGIFCLIAAAACYWCAFTRFDAAELRRNHHVFSTWAVLLLLAGSFLVFPATVNAPWLGVLALAATWAGLRARRFPLAVHGLVYLAAMAVVSGLLPYCAAMLLGEPRSAGWLVWTGYLFALLGCALAWRGFRSPFTLEPGGKPFTPASGTNTSPVASSFMPTSDVNAAPVAQWQQKAVFFLWSVLAAWATLAAAMAGILTVLATAGAARIAAARTLVLCVIALLLGWSGARRRRSELLWLAYVFIAVTTLKLLFEDLRSGSAGAIAFSFFCYGMMWVLVARLAKADKN